MVRTTLTDLRWGASRRATLGPPNAPLECRKTPRPLRFRQPITVILRSEPPDSESNLGLSTRIGQIMAYRRHEA